ncbi:MAG: 2-C-methyl-D-erythritol 4-phosphate cytidylyltransferase [Gammaproteobacteria bacterium]|nr:2-C-methyl-D-erythritol 4-phosphate cytidylyltransferase [Gammaproteobacteria bacterium]
MQYWLVMPAAGRAQRFGAAEPKQYARLLGRTVLEWSLAPFLADPRCEGIVVVLAAGDERFATLGLAARVRAARGGAERSQSVRAGLAALAPGPAPRDWVLVHDAARPCLSGDELRRLLEIGAAHPVGALLAVPLADALKRAEGAAGTRPEVLRTEPREGLWRALTPQLFRYGALCAALDAAHAAGRFPGDEAEAIEWTGQHPALVEGALTNLKVTRAADLQLAAAVLAQQGEVSACA